MRQRVYRGVGALMLFALFALGFSACDGLLGTGPTGEASAAFPDSFAKNILLEEVTGTWCGWCPDGAYRIGRIEAMYPGRVFAVAFHTSDSMEISAKDAVTTLLGGYTGVPCGAVDRLDTYGTILGSRGYWETLAGVAIGTQAICGLEITSTVAGGTLSISVVVGFRTAPQSVPALTVYVTEDAITGYPQYNYLNETVGSVFYQQGNPIVDYVHDHVVRAVLTAATGDSFSDEGIYANVSYPSSFSYQVPASQVASNLSVVAFVHGTGLGDEGFQVLNAQRVRAGDSS